MNPLIQRLAEQAGLRFTQLMSNPMVPVVDGKETDLEKFAELLIRECATVANCPSSFKQTNGYKILRHFGLEEQLV